MKSFVAKLQIGKNGVTSGLIGTLNNALKNHRQARISVLRTYERDRTKMKSLVTELQQKINYKCNCRVLGFTIILNKLKYSQRL